MLLLKNKNLGQYFTPKLVADFMVELINKDKSCSILEPCAGEGIFLKSLQEKNFENIKAYELDANLENESDVSVEYSDYLATNPKEKFDVIIGNPPYVRWKNIPEDLKLTLKTHPNWIGKINGLNDLLYPFIIHSIQKLNLRGELIFITPNFWTSTLHSKKVRKSIIANGSLELMINFNEMKIFEGVSSNILIFKFVKNKSSKPIKVINLNHKDFVDEQTINHLRKLMLQLNSEDEVTTNSIKAYNHVQFVSDESWKPLPPSIEPEINKIEKNANTRLGYIADIGNGMVSGLDNAFKVDNCDSYSEKEKSKLIKVAKSKNLSKYFNDGYTNYIFLNDLAEEREVKELPIIYKKLINHKSDLDKRYSYGGYIPWWHWVFLRNKQLIEKSPKIVVPCKERYDHKGFVRFSLVEGNLYVSQDVTVMVKKPEIKEDIRYFLALLNSDTLFNWLKYRGLKRGGVLEFSEKPLSEIPIRLIDWSNDREVQIHNKIVDLVKQIINTKNEKPFKAEIETLVKEIYSLD